MKIKAGLVTVPVTGSSSSSDPSSSSSSSLFTRLASTLADVLLKDKINPAIYSNFYLKLYPYI